MKTNAAKDLLEAIKAQAVPSVVPKGFYTIRQLCEQTGERRTTIQKRLAEMKCEQKVFRVLSGSLVRPTPHYRLL